ncbi:MAG: hypothetical protein RR340_08115 [Cloacibacillus sp.]
MTNKQNKTTITIVALYNQEHNGIELYFTEKPDEAVRVKIKDAGYRWHNSKKCWYAKDTADTRKAAAKINADLTNMPADIAEGKAKKDKPIKKDKPAAAFAAAVAAVTEPAPETSAEPKEHAKGVFVQNVGFADEQIVWNIRKRTAKQVIVYQKGGEPITKMLKVSAKGTEYIIVDNLPCPFIAVAAK